MIAFAKWRQTAFSAFSRIIAYRGNLILQVLGPALVFYTIKVQLFRSFYASSSEGVIGGYSLEGMLAYQFYTLIVMLIAQSYNSMALAEDIRLGRISAYLIYPFDFLSFHFASFLAFQTVQFLIVGFTLTLAWSFTWIPDLNPRLLAQGYLLCLLAGILWFSLQYLIGVVAFWLEETWVLRVLLMNLSAFLSGAIMPLTFFPQAWQEMVQYSFFPYLTSWPVKAFLEVLPLSELLSIASLLILWTVVIIALGQYTFKRGLRLYTAAGM